jgi:UDP-galactopyranose mutase
MQAGKPTNKGTPEEMIKTCFPLNSDGIDLICFSHLRWRFVFQRPQHLMSRFAKTRPVFFVEEPIFDKGGEAAFRCTVCCETGVVIVTPHLPEADRERSSHVMKHLLRVFMEREQITRYVAWLYTPLALDFAHEITPLLTVYDCMDELSLFRGASARICEVEQELFERADLVFTGGTSLYEAKRLRHPNVYAFPSGVDVAHFFKARSIRVPFAEQRSIPGPRLGYAGVIDERLDIELIDQLSERRPTWQIVMLGPVVKIDPTSLPQRHNLHWLGMKHYGDLPNYFAGWDIGLLPFAMNDATRFISPTKTPEYLAAGLHVVSKPIRDVVTPYGDLGMVKIAHDTEEFIAACDGCLASLTPSALRADIDAFLGTVSWEDTWDAMNKLIGLEVAGWECTESPVREPLPEPSESGGVHV